MKPELVIDGMTVGQWAAIGGISSDDPSRYDINCVAIFPMVNSARIEATDSRAAIVGEVLSGGMADDPIFLLGKNLVSLGLRFDPRSTIRMEVFEQTVEFSSPIEGRISFPRRRGCKWPSIASADWKPETSGAGCVVDIDLIAAVRDVINANVDGDDWSLIGIGINSQGAKDAVKVFSGRPESRIGFYGFVMPCLDANGAVARVCRSEPKPTHEAWNAVIDQMIVEWKRMAEGDGPSSFAEFYVEMMREVSDLWDIVRCRTPIHDESILTRRLIRMAARLMQAVRDLELPLESKAEAS